MDFLKFRLGWVLEGTGMKSGKVSVLDVPLDASMLQLPGFLCLSSLTSLEGGSYHVISQRRSVLHHILHSQDMLTMGYWVTNLGTNAKYPYFALLFHRDALNPEKQQFFAHFPNDHAEQNTAAAGSDVPPPCHPPSMTMMTLMHSPWQTNLGCPGKRCFA